MKRHLLIAPLAGAALALSSVGSVSASGENSAIAPPRAGVVYDDGSSQQTPTVETAPDPKAVSQGEAQRADAATIAKTRGIPVQAAERLLRDQRALNHLPAQMAERFGDNYGGSWFDGQQYVVRFKAAAPEDAVRSIRGVNTEFFKVAIAENFGWSLAEIYGEIDRFEAAARDAGLKTSIGAGWQGPSGINVIGLDTPEVRAFLGANGDALPKSPHTIELVEPVEELVDFQVARGGGKLSGPSNSVCTSAFSFAMPDRDTIASAAHCRIATGSPWLYVPPGGTGIDTSRRAYGFDAGYGDVELMSTTDNEAPSFYFNSSNEVQQVNDAMANTVGQSICYFGRVGGRGCSSILGVDQPIPGTNLDHMIIVDGDPGTKDGDSGAPWFSGGLASGVHSGRYLANGSYRAFYTPINYVNLTIGTYSALKIAP